MTRRLDDARKQTDRLFDLVRPEFLYHRPIAERHRIIFYVGHLEAFDWNLLHPQLPGLKSFAPDFDRLFAFGIDPVDGGLPTDQVSDWPERGQVEAYRERIRGELDSALAVGRFEDSTLLNVAIEHRLMHAETLAYMLHQMPYGQKFSGTQAEIATPGALEPAMMEIPAGRATLGLRRDNPDLFGWDNEFDEHTVDVPAFTVDKYKVTNAEYLKFVEGGGYQDRSLWSAAAWEWKEKQGVEHPAFWTKAGGAWNYRGMFEEIPLPETWPVYVSHAEASAYAAWAGKRLPTEAEWHRAASGAPDPVLPEFSRWDPWPVNAFAGGESEFGVADVPGNGWEWTSTLFAPFAGFRPFPFYEGYSANFFDGMHYVMKGGSPRTASCMLRRSFRNWFQPHYQYAYAGFRCAGK